MVSIPSLLTLLHLLGLALGVGSATVKLVLLLKCRNDPGFVPVFTGAARPITRLIILGIALLVLSGIGWLLLGYGFTPLLILKLVLVAGILALGPVIDHRIEPRFRALAPTAGGPVTPEFVRVERQYLLLEGVATGLFYLIMVVWVLA